MKSSLSVFFVLLIFVVFVLVFYSEILCLDKVWLDVLLVDGLITVLTQLICLPEYHQFLFYFLEYWINCRCKDLLADIGQVAMDLKWLRDFNADCK